MGTLSSELRAIPSYENPLISRCPDEGGLSVPSLRPHAACLFSYMNTLASARFSQLLESERAHAIQGMNDKLHVLTVDQFFLL